MIKYRIIVSKLVANPTGFAARVTSVRAVGLEEIAAEIARLGTTVSQPDVLNVIRHYHEVVALMLQKGETINTPSVCYRTCQFSPAIGPLVFGQGGPRFAMAQSETPAEK